MPAQRQIRKRDKPSKAPISSSISVGVSLNDITTAAYSGKLDLSRFITIGLNDVRIGDDVIPGVRLADVLTELSKLKPASAPYRGTRQAKRLSDRTRAGGES